MFGVSDSRSDALCSRAAEAADIATRQLRSLDEIGSSLAQALAGRIAFDRFNIGLIDAVEHSFFDAFVAGQNVPGRNPGHQRTLHGSVVEAAIQAGDGYYYGNADRQGWLQRFSRFGPVFDSGICAMLAVPLRTDQVVRASLVFASCDPAAYNKQSLAVAVAVGQVVKGRILAAS